VRRPRGTTSGSRLAGWRRFSGALPEIAEPDLDQGSHGLLEARLPRDRERLLPALACLRGSHALLEPVVSGDEQLLDALSRLLFVHPRSVTTVNSVIDAMEADAVAPIRVLIADDHRLFAEALAAILAGEPRIDVAGYARNGAEAVELESILDPDVVLMDISMPIMDGVEATRRIRKRRPNARVLMLTGSNERLDIEQSHEAGAAGYVTKDRIAAELIDAIISVATLRLD
jgi:CheY-like chemotaxis protein